MDAVTRIYLDEILFSARGGTLCGRGDGRNELPDIGRNKGQDLRIQSENEDEGPL